MTARTIVNSDFTKTWEIVLEIQLAIGFVERMSNNQAVPHSEGGIHLIRISRKVDLFATKQKDVSELVDPLFAFFSDEKGNEIYLTK